MTTSAAKVEQRTIGEEAGQIGAQDAGPRVSDAVDAALDLVEDVALLQVAVSAVEPDRGGSDDGRAGFDSGGRCRGLREGNCVGQAQHRRQKKSALRLLSITHVWCVPC